MPRDEQEFADVEAVPAVRADDALAAAARARRDDVVLVDVQSVAFRLVGHLVGGSALRRLVIILEDDCILLRLFLRALRRATLGHEGRQDEQVILCQGQVHGDPAQNQPHGVVDEQLRDALPVQVDAIGAPLVL